jgi:hypothetical protein
MSTCLPSSNTFLVSTLPWPLPEEGTVIIALSVFLLQVSITLSLGRRVYLLFLILCLIIVHSSHSLPQHLGMILGSFYRENIPLQITSWRQN